MKNTEQAHPLPAGAEQLLEHAGWLHALARSLVLDDGEADEVVQETWLSALRASDSVRHPRAWLAGTLRKKLSNRRRSEGRRRDYERRVSESSPSTAPDASTSLQVLERQRALLDRVEALPQAQREAILARYFESLSPREIARRDSTPVETVKDRLKRGLHALRADLDREHGDRAAWAGWLLPLAVETKQRAALGGVTLAASVLVSLTVAFVILTVLQKEDTPRSEARLGAGEVVAPAIERQGESQTELASISTSPKQESRVALPSGGNAASFLIVENENPALDAEVWFITIETIQKLIEAGQKGFDDLEFLCSGHGIAVEVDDAGRVRIDAAPPYFVRATTVRGIGFLAVSEAQDQSTIQLLSSPRVLVQTVDRSNQPVPGIDVRGELTLREPRDQDGRSNDQVFPFFRTTTLEGARFQDPMGVLARFAVVEEEGGEAQRSEALWGEFRIHLPGVAESEPRSIARLALPLDSPEAPLPPLRLMLPELGSLKLHVENAASDSSEVEGYATLRILEHGQTVGPEFKASLSSGTARWPRIALGKRVSIEISVPKAGRQWKIVGLGPVQGGEEVLLRTSGPKRPGLKGRLVDASGKPHKNVTVTAYHGDSYGTGMQKSVEFETASDGSFRFEWPDGAEVFGPLHLVGETVLATGGVVFELARDELLGEGDLGEHTLILRPRQALVGTVVDPDGKALEGVRLGTRRAVGSSWGGETDSEGRFTMSPVWNDTIVLTLYEREGRFPEMSIEVQRSSLDQPLVITMSAGGRIRGGLRPSALANDGSAGSVRVGLEGSEDYSWATIGPDGRFESRALGPGQWNVAISGNASAVVRELGSYELREGETLELDLPSLDELFRVVEVVPQGMPEGVHVMSYVLGAAGGINHPGFGTELLVPREGDWTVRLYAGGRRTLLVDASEIRERYEAHLPPALPVQLLSSAAAPEGYRLLLLGIPGTSNRFESVTLPEHIEPSMQLSFSMPGRYRLYRQRISEVVDLGLAPGVNSEEAKAYEATTEVIEVLDTDQLQDITIDLAAPLPE